MHSNTVSAALAPVQHWQEMDALSLYQVFEQITDERHPRGKRSSLALILSLLIEGEAGRDDHADCQGPRGSAGEKIGCARCCLERESSFPAWRPTARCCAPWRLIRSRRCTGWWLTRLEAARRCGVEPSRLRAHQAARELHTQVAIDGKTVRGTLAHGAPDQRSQQLVAL